MVGLIRDQLMQTNPDLMPADAKRVDPVRQANVPAEFKRDILDLIWCEAGPETLLSIGQGVSCVGHDPIWQAAVRSASPAVVFEKWRRFEVFGHSRNRLRIDHTHENHASFTRYTLDGGTPTAPENLLICGVIIALLEANGCLGLCCDMPLDDGATYRIRDDGRFCVPDDADRLNSAAWTIEWQAVSARTEWATPTAEVPDLALPRAFKTAHRKSIEAAARLLMHDVSRQWKVGELAREAGLSTRSLQRLLGMAELSFSQLVRLVRIHQACHLLKDSDAPITGIGFCTGFCDSAHFSRDFRASMGMTPSEYRDIC